MKREVEEVEEEEAGGSPQDAEARRSQTDCAVNHET